MSRVPFTEIVVSELRSRSNANVCIGVLVVNNRRVGVACTDLDRVADDNALRADQLQTILSLLHELECNDFFIGGSLATDLPWDKMVSGERAAECVDLWEAHLSGLVTTAMSTKGTILVPANFPGAEDPHRPRAAAPGPSASTPKVARPPGTRGRACAA